MDYIISGRITSSTTSDGFFHIRSSARWHDRQEELEWYGICVKFLLCFFIYRWILVIFFSRSNRSRFVADMKRCVLELRRRWKLLESARAGGSLKLNLSFHQLLKIWSHHALIVHVTAQYVTVCCLITNKMLKTWTMDQTTNPSLLSIGSGYNTECRPKYGIHVENTEYMLQMNSINPFPNKPIFFKRVYSTRPRTPPAFSNAIFQYFHSAMIMVRFQLK